MLLCFSSMNWLHDVWSLRLYSFLNIEFDASLIIFFFDIWKPFLFPFELPYKIVSIWLLIYFQVRHRLRKDYGIEGGFPVVFSLEKPKVKLLPFKGSNGEEDNPADYQVRMLAYYFEILHCLCFPFMMEL